MGLIVGLILAFTIPLVFLGIIRKADFYQVGEYHLILISMGGGILAYLFASLTNITLRLSSMLDPSTIELFIAPVLEEILKGLVLLCLIRFSRFTFSVDGALYGFAIGIGFAILENYEYIFRDISIGLVVALQRVFSANLVHATGAAIIGIALGVFQLRGTGERWFILALGLFLAIGQHMLYNIISYGGTSLVGAFGIGILGTVFIYFAMQSGKRQAQNWIKQKLGMDDRVTRGEVAVVERLSSMDDLLLPVVERFGAETAVKVEKLLYLQARLGIKWKTLESFQNNRKMRQALEVEISELRMEMEKARREIGLYAMLFVRGLFTEEMISVWERMQAKIRERSALNGNQKGGGLWSSLEERLKAPTDSLEPE